ncbi:MAG: cysteine desulfurase family protein [Bacteroidota bacterium]
MKRIYFDNAATTAIAPEVIDLMSDLMSTHYGNPSSIHREGRESRTVIEQARKTIANLIGASIGEIFFTSGGTESNNMVLRCSVRDLGVKRIITSPLEHHCILHTLEAMEAEGQVTVDHVKVDKKGRINLMHLESLLEKNEQKTLVTLMHCNNEIGTLLDLEKVAEICEAHQVFFHSDTVQTMGYFPIDVSKMRINFLSGSAHKFHGPKGVGFIYINGDNIVQPLINGGAQERNMRAGTENLYGIAGMAKALQMSYDELAQKRAHISKVRAHFKSQLQEYFEDIQFNGDHDGAFHYKTLSVSFPPSPKSELLLLNLDMLGITASGGSACSSGVEKGSHVLEGIRAEPSRKSIRFSFSKYNTIEEVDRVIEKLKTIVELKATVV